MKQTLGRKEKLKSKILIGKLFSEGKSVKKFPVKLVHLSLASSEENRVKVGFSVPKRSFKHAVDRNYLKRLLREAYRKNKHLLEDENKNQAFMFIYLGRKKATLPELEKAIQKLLVTFNDTEQTR
jgi:ribonuclease P protein component